MDRLTEHFRGYIRVKGCTSLYVNNERKGAPMSNSIIRLAAYEDTGLGPDEITKPPAGCVFYCNRQCNLYGDFCAEGPGCPYEIDAESAMRTFVHPDNIPLTIDELREMDGEPVWVERPGYGKRWALVQVFAKSTNIVYLTYNNGSTLLIQAELDCSVKVYRRKPEDVTT